MIGVTRAKFLALAVFFVLVCVLTEAYANRDTLIIVLNGVFIGVSVFLVASLVPLSLRAMRDRNVDRISQLTFGIVLTWIAIILLRGNNIWGRHVMVLGKLGFTWAIPTAIYLSIFGAVLQISAPGVVDWATPSGRFSVAWKLLLAITVGVIGVVYQINPYFP